MSVFNKFNSFVEAVAEKVHNLQSDSLMIALTDTLPVNTNTQLSNITQIAAGNGYTTGGNAAAQSSSAQTGGVYKLVLNDTVFTATGAMAQFRYAVLYNNTATNKELIGWYDYGAEVNLLASETFTVHFDASAGVLTIT